MKNNFLIIALLGAAFSGIAFGSDVPGPQKLMWNEIPMTDALAAFDGYVTPGAPIDSPDYLQSNIIKYFKQLITSVPKPIGQQMESTIINLVQSFVNQTDAALKDSDVNNSKKKLIALESYLDTTGKFLAKMYNDAVAKPVWITSEVALRGTTFGSEYRKEYFLVDENDNKVDNEKIDGQFYFFYSEPTTKPGILRVLGLGYVDKRSWKKYLFEKVKYPALVSALSYGAYKGSQTEQGQQWMKSVQESGPYKYVANSQVGQWVGKNVPEGYKSARGYVSDAMTVPRSLFKNAKDSAVNYFSPKDQKEIKNIENKQMKISRESKKLEEKKLKKIENVEKKAVTKSQPRHTEKPRIQRGSGFGTSGVVAKRRPRHLSTPEELHHHLARKHINERKERKSRWF